MDQEPAPSVKNEEDTESFSKFGLNHSLVTSSNNQLILIQNDGAALTIDTSKNATFAAAVDIETGISLESGVLVIKNATGDSSGLRIFQD